MSPKELQRHHLAETVAHIQVLVDCLKNGKLPSQPELLEYSIFPKSRHSEFESISVADSTKKLHQSGVSTRVWSSYLFL